LFENELVRQLKRRKRRKKTATIVSVVSSIGIAIMLIIAFCIITTNKFTIETNETALALSIVDDRSIQTTKLQAPPLLKAKDTQYTDIPENIEDKLGEKSCEFYFAYSFYLIGQSVKPNSINYSMTMTLEAESNDLMKAIRVMTIKDGLKRVYAKAADDGSPKLIYDGVDHTAPPTSIVGSTIPFKDNKHIILEPYNIIPGDYTKFTIVIWIDGWESVNEMKGGVFQANLKFSTISVNNL